MDYNHILNANHQIYFGTIYKLINIISEENVTEKSDIMTEMIMHVHAQTPLVYLSAAGNLFGRVRYYGGLSWQQNYVRVNSEEPLIQNSINPTMQLSLPLGKNGEHSLSFIYKHILDRIPYDAISEKKIWSDAYNYTVGNRMLKAPTEHSVNLIAGLWNNKLNLSTSYWYDKNTIYWQTFNDSDNKNVFYTQPVNLDPLSIFILQGNIHNGYSMYGQLRGQLVLYSILKICKCQEITIKEYVTANIIHWSTH